MRINPQDTVLTLTSGGCNALNLILNGAGHVVSVDCNPAQSSLLELKAVAIQQLEFEDVWQLFGEGKHPHIERLFETRLAPYLTQKAYNFWSTRLWYFKQGLYYQGGMVGAHDTGGWVVILVELMMSLQLTHNFLSSVFLQLTTALLLPTSSAYHSQAHDAFAAHPTLLAVSVPAADHRSATAVINHLSHSMLSVSMSQHVQHGVSLAGQVVLGATNTCHVLRAALPHEAPC